MASVSPRDFAARLSAMSERLRGAARFAAEGVIDGMTEIALASVERLKETTPRSTGRIDTDGNMVPTTDHIADGWALKVDTSGDAVTVQVANENPRALAPLAVKGGGETSLLRILEYGSKQHEIRPVKASALRFIGDTGATVYANFVKHPGTEPYGMVAMARIEAAVDLKKLIDATRTVLKRSGRAAA
jgi:hypothetical protein